LGARVSIVEMASILPRDDPELVDILRNRLRAEGLRLYEGAKVASVAPTGGGVAVAIERDGGQETLEGTALLLAAGRKPAVGDLGLEAAGIAYGAGGVKVDRRLRTSNKRVFAAGDVCGGYQFTHMAGHHAGVVIKNALFRLPAAVETRAVPWVTYCDPELAHVGLDEDTARQREGAIRILRWPFHENDRARAERRPEGLVKVIATAGGRVLGASVLGAQAGEVIQPWILAIARKIPLSAMAQMIAPYPTFGEANKLAAAGYFVEKLFNPRTKWLVRLLARLG
jgi:pyruvate/2-oxoglutarate dehydrogenase complex dihydrolipoamide dehydrogenase (E3) component